MCFAALWPAGAGPPSIAVVRKTFLPQMIGDEKPSPGIATFQSTFFVSLHSVGRFFSVEMPWLSGPRHCAQFPVELSGFVLACVDMAEIAEQATDMKSNTVRIR